MSVSVGGVADLQTCSGQIVECAKDAVRVLVVDDSPQFLQIVCVLLELEGQVDVVGRANNGEEAIRAVATLKPDLVLMDVQMPTMNGFSAALIISTCFPSTRVVLMSADDSPYVRQQSRVCGACAFMPKRSFAMRIPELLRYASINNARSAASDSR